MAIRKIFYIRKIFFRKFRENAQNCRKMKGNGKGKLKNVQIFRLRRAKSPKRLLIQIRMRFFLRMSKSKKNTGSGILIWVEWDSGW